MAELAPRDINAPGVFFHSKTEAVGLCLADLDIRTLYYSSPLNDVDQQRHDSQDQQQVNESP
jgi:hypothetical protein